MLTQRFTKLITSGYTTTEEDCGYRLVCNSEIPFEILLHEATGRYNFEMEIDNIGVGQVTCNGQVIKRYAHAHVGNTGTAWTVVLGGSEETDPIFVSSPAHEIESGDILNWDSAYVHAGTTHAPANAQKNSDITKGEIEAKLIGTITSHEHPNSDTSSDLIRFDKEAYYLQNVKTIATYQDSTLYGSSIAEQDSINVLIGSGSVKIPVKDDLQAARAIVKTAPEGQLFDFTKFPDGSLSAVGDYIRLVCYISDVTKVTYVVVFFMCASGYFYTLWSAGLVNGWNYLELKKSSAPISGSPDWSAVSNIQTQWFNNPSANGTYISFQLLEMVRQDPSGTTANPFQVLKNNVRVEEFTRHTGHYFLGIYNNNLVCKPISDGSFFGLLSKKAVLNSNNTTYIKRKCVSTAYDNGLGYYLDDNNFIRIYIVSNLLMAVCKVAGIQTVNQITGSLNLQIDDIITYRLTKNGSSVFTQVLINEDPMNSANYSFETTMSESILVMLDSSTMGGAFGGYIEEASFSSGNFLFPSKLLLGETADKAYYGDKGKTAYDHSQSLHAPLLTGEVSTHYHRTPPQQWYGYPDTPEAYPGERYQCIAAYPPPYGDNDIVIITSDKELYTNSNALCTATYYLFSSGEWQLSYHNYGTTSIGPATILASNYDIYATSDKETLIYSRQNDYKVHPNVENRLQGQITHGFNKIKRDIPAKRRYTINLESFEKEQLSIGLSEYMPWY